MRFFLQALQDELVRGHSGLVFVDAGVPVPPTRLEAHHIGRGKVPARPSPVDQCPHVIGQVDAHGVLVSDHQDATLEYTGDRSEHAPTTVLLFEQITALQGDRGVGLQPVTVLSLIHI